MGKLTVFIQVAGAMFSTGVFWGKNMNFYAPNKRTATEPGGRSTAALNSRQLSLPIASIHAP